MDNQNPTYSAIISPDFKEKIFDNIVKAKAVLTCVMFAAEFLREDMKLDNNTIYHALWVIDDFLEELEKIFNT